MTPMDRKLELIRAGIEQVTLVEELGVSSAMVSRVVAGKYLASPRGQRIARAIAAKLKRPLLEVFPELEGKVGGPKR